MANALALAARVEVAHNEGLTELLPLEEVRTLELPVWLTDAHWLPVAVLHTDREAEAEAVGQRDELPLKEALALVLGEALCEMQAVGVAHAEAREEVEPLCVTETVNEAGGLELPQCVPDTLGEGLRVPEALPQAVELLRGDRELLPLLLLHALSLALPEEKALGE